MVEQCVILTEQRIDKNAVKRLGEMGIGKGEPLRARLEERPPMAALVFSF